jgi:hypothetical protein
MSVTTIDDLTPAYLTEALGRPVAAVRHEPVGVGVGLIGQLYRIHLSYPAGTSGPDRLVAKLPGATEEARFVGMVLNMYQKECGFYQDLAGATGDLSPASHHVTFAADSHDFVVLLDDVGHHRQPDQIAGIDLADAETAVRALARLNATWWEHPDLLASPYVRPLNESPFPEAVAMSFDGAWPIALETYGSMMSDGIREFGARYSGLFPWFCDRLCEAPVTLTHGDWRGDNLFLTGDPAVPVIAVDWQLISAAKGVKDFTYFVTQSLRVEDRQAHEEGLLRIWLDELHANGIGGYEFDQAWEDYRLAVAWAFVYPVIATSTLDPTDARGAALTRSMMERSIAAIEWLGALTLVPDSDP